MASNTSLKAIELEAGGCGDAPKPKRYTHALLDSLDKSQKDLSTEVGRSKFYSFVALLSVAVLLGSMVAANIAGYELVKETKVKGGRLETRDGEPVKVALVGDLRCPLVALLEMDVSERMNQKFVTFHATDSASTSWEFAMHIAETQCEPGVPHFFIQDVFLYSARLPV